MKKTLTNIKGKYSFLPLLLLLCWQAILPLHASILTVANTPPTFTSDSVETVLKETVYTYNITTEDLDGDAVTITAPLLPEWLTLTDNEDGTATLTGTAPNTIIATQPEVYEVSLLVEDTNNDSTPQNFLILVTNSNAPTFTSQSITTATADVVYTYNITTEDSDGDAVTITDASAFLVEWLTLTDNEDGTATLTGTPTTGDIGGLHEVLLDVVDENGDYSLQIFSIDVVAAGANNSPAFTSSSVETIIKETVYTYNITTEDTDGDDVTITAPTLPEWLTLTDNGDGTATLTGTAPTTASPTAPDTYEVSLQVKDINNSSTPQEFSILVTNSNAPTFTSQSITTATADVVYTYNITTEDSDGDAVTITDASAMLVEWLTLTDNGDGTATLTGTPTADDIGGFHDVFLEVVDENGDSSFQPFSIDVVAAGVNNSPTFTSTEITEAYKNGLYTYNITTEDSDGDVVTITTGATLPEWLTLEDNGDGTATLSGTPGDNEVGNSYDITLQVDDSKEGTDSQNFTIDVSETPFISSTPDMIANVGIEYTYSITTTPVAESDELTISKKNPFPSWLTLEDNGDGTATVSGTPGAGKVGEHEVNIKVKDQENRSSIQTFTINVTDNNSPSFDSTPVTEGTEDEAYTYTVEASDEDGDDLAFTGTTLPNWLTLTDNGDGTATLEGSPDDAGVGTNSIVITVDDGNGGIVNQEFDIEVANINDAPVFASDALTGATEDILYQYTVIVSDNDQDASLTLDVDKKPEWLTLNDNGDGTYLLEGTPTDADVGKDSVVLRLTDDIITDSVIQRFEILVVNINDVPSITSTPTESIDQDAEYTYTIEVSDEDINDVITITATQKPDWLNFTDNEDRTATLTATPTNSDVGKHFISIQADDNNGGKTTQVFSLTVNNINDAPTMEIEFEATLPENSPQGTNVGTVNANDIDGDALTYMIKSGNESGAFNISNDGIVTVQGTIDYETTNSYSLVVEVSDGNGGTVESDPIAIEVINEISLSLLSSSAPCNSNDGDAYLILNEEGTAPYFFALDVITDYRQASGVDTLMTGLSAGEHTIYVQDANGVTNSLTFTLNAADTPLDMNTITSNANCSTGGSLTVNVTGGIAPFTLYVNGQTYNSSSNFTFNNQPAGEYDLQLIDKNGCSVTKTAWISYDEISLPAKLTTVFYISEGSGGALEIGQLASKPDIESTLAPNEVAFIEGNGVALNGDAYYFYSSVVGEGNHTVYYVEQVIEGGEVICEKRKEFTVSVSKQSPNSNLFSMSSFYCLTKANAVTLPLQSNTEINNILVAKGHSGKNVSLRVYNYGDGGNVDDALVFTSQSAIEYVFNPEHLPEGSYALYVDVELGDGKTEPIAFTTFDIKPLPESSFKIQRSGEELLTEVTQEGGVAYYFYVAESSTGVLNLSGNSIDGISGNGFNVAGSDGTPYNEFLDGDKLDLSKLYEHVSTQGNPTKLALDITYEYQENTFGCVNTTTKRLDIYLLSLSINPTEHQEGTGVFCINSGQTVNLSGVADRRLGKGSYQVKTTGAIVPDAEDGLTDNGDGNASFSITDFVSNNEGNNEKIVEFLFTYEYTPSIQVTVKDNITIKPLPVLSITGLEAEGGTSLDGKLYFCEDFTKIVNIQGANSDSNVSSGSFSGVGVQDNGDGTATFDVQEVMTSLGDQPLLPYNHTISFTYSDENGCETSVDKSIIIKPLPKMEIQGLNLIRSYCATNTDDIVLIGKPFGGTFYVDGKAVTNKNADGNFYFRIEDLDLPGNYSDHTVTYTVTQTDKDEDGNFFECGNTVTEEFRVVPRLDIDFEVEYSCDNEETIFDLTILNEDFKDIDKSEFKDYRWEIKTLAGELVFFDVEKTLVHNFADPGTYEISLSVTTPLGCDEAITKEVKIDQVPKLDFIWQNIVVTDDVPTHFTIEIDESLYNDVVSYSWDYNDGSAVDVKNGKEDLTTEHFYTQHGKYNVKLELMTIQGCTRSITREINILPRSITNFPYSQTFEDENGGWFTSVLDANSKVIFEDLEATPPVHANNSWTYGAFHDTLKVEGAEDNKMWIASPAQFKDGESSQLYTPAFDLRELDRPMLKVKLRHNLLNNLDGVVLQYSLNSKDWLVLGNDSSGINWYHSNEVRSKPGFQDQTRYGWTGEQETWLEGRYSLEEFTDVSALRFRFALETDVYEPAQDAIKFYIAIDDFWVGNRQQILMIENFIDKSTTNAGNYLTASENLITERPLDIQVMNYFKELPTIFEASNRDIMGRGLFYHTDDSLKSIINGDVDNIQEVDNLNLLHLDSLFLTDPMFKMTVDDSQSDNETYKVVVDLEAQMDLELNLENNERIGLFIATINTEADIEGTSYKHVFNRLLPSPAGILFPQVSNQIVTDSTLAKGWSASHTFEWKPTEQKDIENLRIVAFVQHMKSRKILQAVMITEDNVKYPTELSTVTSLTKEELSDQITVFPNPAHATLNVRLPQLYKNTIWQVRDMQGRIIRSGEDTDKQFRVDINHLSTGMYILQINTDGKLIHKKFTKE